MAISSPFAARTRPSIASCTSTSRRTTAPRRACTGHSIGRWDGGTLVVDTARFTPHRLGNGAGLPSGAGKHLVERFALNAEGGLTYSFELEDPEYLKERVTGTSQWLYRPDVEYVATPCDRDNARRFLAE